MKRLIAVLLCLVVPALAQDNDSIVWFDDPEDLPDAGGQTNIYPVIPGGALTRASQDMCKLADELLWRAGISAWLGNSTALNQTGLYYA